MSAHISRDVSNDDPRHYFFERNSGLPRGYFDPPKLSVDGWVYVICIALVALLLMATKTI